MAWPRAACIRTDLAEITHARYGILSADQWRAIIGPMLNAQVDKLDLKGQSKSLRPMVERSLYALLDNIKTQMTSARRQGIGHARRGQRDVREHDRRIPASACAGVHQRGDGGTRQAGNAKELQGLHPRRAGRCGQEHVQHHGHDHL